MIRAVTEAKMTTEEVAKKNNTAPVLMARVAKEARMTHHQDRMMIVRNVKVKTVLM